MTPSDVAWAINLHKSHAQLAWCLEHLRQHFPDSRVVLISDGDTDRYDELAERFGCEYVHGEHLMRLETGHLYLARMLSHLLDGDETYLFKVDPDTRVWRRFSQLPACSAIFGTLETISEGGQEEIPVPANVQGGCIGLTRDAAEEIMRSGILNVENCAVNCERTWARCGDMTRSVSCGRFCEDFALSWAAHDRAIPMVESSEIRSRWRRRMDNTDLRYAITHPHKL